MNWLAWRQTRTAMVVLAGVLVIYIGLGTWERLAHGHLNGMTQSLSAYLYLFLALFLGAPLVAREYDTGTYQLAWSQSVTRARWLTVRLGVNGSLALAAAGVLHLVLNAAVRARPYTVHGVEAQYLASHGPLPYLEALAVVALGTAAGALIGRLLPALAATLVCSGFLVQLVASGTGLQPFWPQELIRGGILTALTAGLVALTYRLVGRKS